MTSMATIALTDFGDGLNTKMPKEKLKTSEASSVANLRTIGGTLYPRKNKVLEGVVVAEKPVHSLFSYEDSSGSKFLFAGCGTKLFKKELFDKDAPWAVPTHQKRIKHIFRNKGTSTLVNYVVEIPPLAREDSDLCGSGGMSIEFRDSNGLVLNCWVAQWELVNDQHFNRIMVKLPLVPAGSSVMFYMYFDRKNEAHDITGLGQGKDGVFYYAQITHPIVSDEFVSSIVRWDGRNDWGTQQFLSDKKLTFRYTQLPYVAGSSTIFREFFTDSKGKSQTFPFNTIVIWMNTERIWINEEVIGWVSGAGGTISSVNIAQHNFAIGKISNSSRFTIEVNFSSKAVWAGSVVVYQNGDFLCNISFTSTFPTEPLIKALGRYWQHYLDLKDIFVYYGSGLPTEAPTHIVFASEGIGQSAVPAVWTEEVGAALTSENPINHVSIANTLIIANGVDRPRAWNGATWAIWGDTIGLNVSVKYLAVHKGRLFAANGGGGEKSRLYYCNVTSQGKPAFEKTTDWQTAEPTIGGGTQYTLNYEDFIGDGVEITGLVPSMYDSLLIGKPDGITLLYGSSPENWGKKRLPYPYGIIAPQSVAKYEDTLFFVSKLGIHWLSGESGNDAAFTFDNIKANSLAESIEPEFFSQTIASAVGVAWDKKYYLFFSDTMKCFVLDWRRKSWWIDIGEQIQSATIETVSNILYVGESSGSVYKYENDTAVVANNYWQSGIIQPLPGWEVRIREIMISLKGSVKMTISSDQEPPTLFSPIQITTTGTGLKHVRVGHNIQGKQFELQLANITESIERVELSIISLRKA